MSDENTNEPTEPVITARKTEATAITAVTSKVKSEEVDMAFVKELRKENMSHRLAKYELEEKLNAAEAGFTKRLEDEKSKAREEAKAEVQHEIALARFEALAIKDGLNDPDVLKLLDTSKFVLKDGKLTNGEELLKEFRAAKPHFFAKQATSSTTKAPSEADSTAKNVADMSREEFAAYKKAKGLN